jgi:predicted DNA-binding mobile mystery protein A
MRPASAKNPPDRALARLRLDSRLEPLRANRGAMAIPRGGWLRAVRRALGMSLEDVALQLRITRSSVTRLETSEQKGTIQLDSLRRAAEALNCELAYVLIPKVSLETTVEQQRLKVARQLNAQVRTHMSLEDQDTRDPNLEKWREDRAMALVRDRQLWKTRK